MTVSIYRLVCLFVAWGHDKPAIQDLAPIATIYSAELGCRKPVQTASGMVVKSHSKLNPSALWPRKPNWPLASNQQMPEHLARA